MADLTSSSTNQFDQAVDNQPQLSRVRFPIRAKITLPYLLLALAFAIGAGFIVNRIVFDNLEDRFTNQLIESRKLASEGMVRVEVNLLSAVRLFTFAEGIPDAIRAGDAERLRDLAYGIAVDQQQEAVEFLNHQGQLVLSMRHIAGGRIEEYEFVSGGDHFSRYDFVGQTMAQQVDGRGNKFAGVIDDPAGDFFYVSGPVYDARNEFVGVVLVGKSLPELVRRLREETLSQVTLYDMQGEVLASTLYAPLSVDAENANISVSQQDEVSLMRNMESRRELNASNIDYAELLGPWEMRGDVDLGLLGTALPKSFLLTTSQVTRLQVSLLAGIALALVVFMGLTLATYITRPLLGLVRASSQVAAGNLDVKVAPDTNDEVAQLAEAFNDMVSSLHTSRQELLNAHEGTLEGWSKALELRDKETEGHTLRVTNMTVRLAQVFGFSDEDLLQLQRGSLLHDIGKLGVPDSILLKPGPLTDEEWEIMRQHPQYARDMIWPIEHLRAAIDIPFCHHERWDGTGYPRGLKGEEIPLAARLFAVVDAWDAMNSDRPYRQAVPIEQSMAETQAGRGKQFDPQVTDIFMQLLADEKHSAEHKLPQ